MHKAQVVWGHAVAATLQGLTHFDYYRQKYFGRKEVQIEVGQSYECLSRFPHASFDMIYIDADHRFEWVRRDAAAAVQKVKSDGTLIFNDYVMSNHITNESYGIVPVVNDLVVNGGWRVVALALHPAMFCDIAIRHD